MFKKMKLLFVATLMCSLVGCGSAQQDVTSESKVEESVVEDVTQATTQAVTTQESTTQEVKVEKNGPVLTYIGHASIKLQTSDGRIILIDPNMYSATEYEDEADFVLVTHEHGDHQPCDKVKLKADGVQITWKEALVDGEYQTFEYDGIKIEAVVAGGNTNHPIGMGVGYLVTFDDICVYHAGDSSNDEALHVLKDYEIDYALYPIDGMYNMNAVEATELANIIGAKNNIPIHMYNTGTKDKSEKFTPDGRLVIKEGDFIQLEK